MLRLFAVGWWSCFAGETFGSTRSPAHSGTRPRRRPICSNCWSASNGSPRNTFRTRKNFASGPGSSTYSAPPGWIEPEVFPHRGQPVLAITVQHFLVERFAVCPRIQRENLPLIRSGHRVFAGRCSDHRLVVLGRRKHGMTVVGQSWRVGDHGCLVPRQATYGR